jgi:hypothetical protein
MKVSGTIVNFIIQLIAGAVGGNAAGGLLKNINLGPLGNTIAGAAGGGIGGSILSGLIPALGSERRGRFRYWCAGRAISGRRDHWRYRHGAGRPHQKCLDQKSLTLPAILEHVPKKLLDFFDQDMLQLFDFELRPYRSNDSI